MPIIVQFGQRWRAANFELEKWRHLERHNSFHFCITSFIILNRVTSNGFRINSGYYWPLSRHFLSRWLFPGRKRKNYSYTHTFLPFFLSRWCLWGFSRRPIRGFLLSTLLNYFRVYMGLKWAILILLHIYIYWVKKVWCWNSAK